MKNNKNVKEITVKIDGEKWEKALDNAFKKLNAKAKIDGFRPGKAPKAVFLKHYGIESLYNEAAESAMEDAYKLMLEEAKDLEFVARPSLDIKDIDEKHIEYVFYITTRPEVKLGKYKELGIKPKKVTVTKEEIEHTIEHMREHYKENIIKEGAIEEGNIAVIDYEGFDGEKAFEGGKAENYPLEIGSHTFVPGFEEQLIGLKAGDEKDINVTFPEDYHAEELKGKPVVFKVKVHEIKEVKIPELDEDFFADLGMDGVDSKESLEKQVKENIKASKERENENKYLDELLEAIAKETEIDIPESMIIDETDRMIDEFSNRIQMQGISIDNFLKYTNSTLDDLKDKYKEEAEKRIKYRLILEEIAKEEKVKVTDDEVEKELDEMAKKYNMTKEEVKKQYNDNLDYIKYDLQFRKVFNIIKGE